MARRVNDGYTIGIGDTLCHCPATLNDRTLSASAHVIVLGNNTMRAYGVHLHHMTGWTGCAGLPHAGGECMVDG